MAVGSVSVGGVFANDPITNGDSDVVWPQTWAVVCRTVTFTHRPPVKCSICVGCGYDPVKQTVITPLNVAVVLTSTAGTCCVKLAGSGGGTGRGSAKVTPG